MDPVAVINACDIKMQRHGISALTPVERTVALASVVNFELEQGDMSSFFHNSASAHVSEIIEALLALGAVTEAAAIRKGRDLLRNNSWEALSASGAFRAATNQFRSSPEDVFSRLCRYVEEHLAELTVVQQLLQADAAAQRGVS